MRDDFPISIKRVLAARVGHRCSRPECRASTSGPRLAKDQSVNIGVAAHITAASPTGPRFDPTLSEDDRSGIDNGIWLCQGCGKLVDNDEQRFSVQVLREWKSAAERDASDQVGRTAKPNESYVGLMGSSHPEIQMMNGLDSDTLPAVGMIPQGSRVPYPRNPLFTGHQDRLIWIAKQLRGETQSPVVCPVVGISGIGGIGKTQLATEFVHRYGQFFPGGVFWINCTSQDAISFEFAQCGTSRHLNICAGFEALPLETQVELILAAWDSPVPRLVVLDNCEDEDILVRWKRPSGGTRTLVTSRRPEWPLTLGVIPCPMGVLRRQEGTLLLSKYLPAEDSSQQPVLASIAEALGDLPLALHLAGSFLARYRNIASPTDYLQALSREDLLDHPSLKGRGLRKESSPTDHEQHVARTFAISLERLQGADATDEVALKMLARTACLIPNVPFDFSFLPACVDLDDEDEDAQLLGADAAKRLLELGLIESAGEMSLRMHRLLSLFSKRAIVDLDAESDVEEMFTVTLEFWNGVEHSRLPAIMQAHIRSMAQMAMARGDERGSALALEFGEHLYLSGDYPGAEKWLVDLTTMLGAFDAGWASKTLANALNRLGVVYRNLGKLTEAEACYDRCESLFRIDEGGEAGPAELALFNNRGMLFQDLSRYDEAMSEYQKALEIARVNRVESPYWLATTLYNIGLLLHNWGQLEEAEKHYLDSLQIRSDLGDSDSWRFATLLDSLGSIYSARGEYDLSEAHFKRALEIQRFVLAEGHPDTARTIANLGKLYESRGEHESAAACYSEASRLYETALGRSNPLTLAAVSELASSLIDSGSYDAAEAHLDQLLIESEQAASTPPLESVRDLSQRADIALAKRELDRAETFFRRAMAVLDEMEDAPALNVAMCCTKLAQVLHSRGKDDEAYRLHQRALRLVESEAGPENEATAGQLSIFGQFLLQQGRDTAALSTIERAVKIFQHIDADPSHHASLVNNLGTLYVRKGKLLQAQDMFERALRLKEQANSGVRDGEYIQGLNSLATTVVKMGYFTRARPLLEQALVLGREMFAGDNEIVASTLTCFSGLLFKEQDYSNAAAVGHAAYRMYEGCLGANDPRTQRCALSLEVAIEHLPPGTSVEQISIDERALSREIDKIKGLQLECESRLKVVSVSDSREEKLSVAEGMRRLAVFVSDRQLTGSPYLDFAGLLNTWAARLESRTEGP